MVSCSLPARDEDTAACLLVTRAHRELRCEGAPPSPLWVVGKHTLQHGRRFPVRLPVYI